MAPDPNRTRNRLIETASRMFYEEGITATGVDAITDRAGVSKPTLYRHFGSKQALVTATLEQRHAERKTALLAQRRAHPDNPLGQLMAVFDWLARWHAADGHRGCAFLNAAAEVIDAQAPSRQVIADHKRWIRDYLSELAREAGLRDPDGLGYDLLFLLDGANARVLAENDDQAAHRAAELAELLIARAQDRKSAPRAIRDT
jgi:AcrR family transcriptional regulator